LTFFFRGRKISHTLRFFGEGVYSEKVISTFSEYASRSLIMPHIRTEKGVATFSEYASRLLIMPHIRTEKGVATFSEYASRLLIMPHIRTEKGVATFSEYALGKAVVIAIGTPLDHKSFRFGFCDPI
jgi:hypothetical protein